MSVSFDQIGQHFLTMTCDDGETLGYPCKLSASGTVCDAASGNVFCGVISTIRDGCCSMLHQGFVELVYTGTTAPSLGYSKLVADGSGGVKVDTTNGREYLVLTLDTTDKIVGIYL